MERTMNEIYKARDKTIKLRISPKAWRVAAERIIKAVLGRGSE